MALLTGAGSTANPGIERAEVLGRLGAVHSFAVSWRSASELFSQALDEAPIDAPLRADLEVDLAIALMVTGDIPAALAHARTGLELAETSANASLLAVALSTLGFMSFALGEGLPVDLFARALEYEDEEPRVWIPFGPRLIAAAALKYSDRFDAARDLLAQELLGRREVGDEARISFLLYHLAELECWTGHMDLAANLAEQSDEAAILTGQFAHRAASLYARALVAAYRGRLDEAAIGARDSLELALRAANVPVAQQATAVLGFVELSRGNPAGADAFLGPLINAVIAFGLGEPGILRFLPDEVEALIALGDLDRARAALDPFEARAEAMERRSAQATSARCRGLLHAAEGNFEKALRACEAAVARHADLPLPFELGRTLLVTGHIERRAGRRKAARGSLERACAIFEELGASSWADTARRELSSIGGRQPAGSGLTASERRVAELVAEGLTNREVASALSLTERTIESHLSRVYAKLGVRSRSELAHRLTARLGSER